MACILSCYVMNIEVIAGSPRQGSLSHRVALYLHKQLVEVSTHNIGLINMQDQVIPPIQKVWTSAEAAPEEFRGLARRMFAADAFILVSPEYNGGYSPALKNMLDHFPKQFRKVFGICTSSDGIMGGMRASQQLLQLVPALFGFASPTLLIVPEVNKKFDEQGNLLVENFGSKVHEFITNFLWLAEAVHKAKQ